MSRPPGWYVLYTRHQGIRHRRSPCSARKVRASGLGPPRQCVRVTSLVLILRAAAGASQEGLTSLASPRALTMSAGKAYPPSMTPCDCSMTRFEPSSSLFASELAFFNSASGLKFSHATFLFCFLHSAPALHCASAPSRTRPRPRSNPPQTNSHTLLEERGDGLGCSGCPVLLVCVSFDLRTVASPPGREHNTDRGGGV